MNQLLSLLLISLTICGAVNATEFNLDFEQVKQKKATGWTSGGNENYLLTMDKQVTQHGAYAALIQYHGDKPASEYIFYTIPQKYQGKKITLSGFIKTENVNEGYAGLWMNIQPRIAFADMEDKGISGTTDWTKYELTLDLKAAKAKSINIGGELRGTGKVWFDNLQLSIDGVPIANAPLKPVLPLEDDHQFDQGSAITLPVVNERQIENLNLLGKVWGFLKYHHPVIAQGKYNWDYELFRVLPKFLAATGRSSRDKVLSAWITSLGDVALCKQCLATAANAVLKPDLNWIDKFELSETLKQQLHYLYDNRHQGANYYVSAEAGTGSPNFDNEKRYQDMQYPDVGFRLLALYRYWNIIHYYFPSKHLTDNNWNGVLKQYIAKFVAAKDELAYEQAVAQLIAEIDDTHATVNMANALEAWKGSNYPPVTLRLIAGKLIVTGYYNQALKQQSGLKIRDVISKINGVAIDDIVSSKQSYYSASNRAVLLKDIAYDILRANSKTIALTYIRDKQEIKHSLGLYDYKALNMWAWYRGAKDGKAFELLANNIGFINLRHLQSDDITALKKRLINTKGIIIDMRKYPGSFSWNSLGAFFTSKATEIAKVTQVNLNNPGEVVFFAELDLTDNESITYRNKVVVLVNEFTQSAAEYYAMAIQAGNNTTVIGSTTAGADGEVSRIYLPGNIATFISGMGIYYPDGRQTQRIGIIPDIEVIPTVAGIKAGRDELLERAISFITL